MAATITVEDIKEFINTTLPDAVLAAFIATVDRADACLDGTDLSDETVKVMKLYAVAHMIETTTNGNISSQSAPSGASRSFKDKAGLSGTSYGMTLQMMPSYGCLSAIIDGANQPFFDVIQPGY